MTISTSANPVSLEKKRELGLLVCRHWLGGELGRRLRGECGVGEGERIVVGVSGGADSVALLLGCVVLGRRSGGVLPLAVHVHHHLRVEADEDAAWVEGLCRGLGVDFRLEDVWPGEEKGNVSGNARRLRYQALGKVAGEVGARFVAVGHHGDDQFETILMGLCRGAGLGGLAGMAWRRELGESGDSTTFRSASGRGTDSSEYSSDHPLPNPPPSPGKGEGISLIRPLLGVRKGDCEEFCRVAGVEWREDAGNVEGSGVRARLRREVLPVLEELWPGVGGRGEAVAESVGAAEELMMREVERVFGEAGERVWERGRLRGEAMAVVAAGLRRAGLAMKAGVGDELGQDHLLGAARVICSEERRPKQFCWPGGLVCEVSSRKVCLCFSEK